MLESNNVVISGEKPLTIDRFLNISERGSQILDFLPARRIFNALVRRLSVPGRLLRETRADTALEFAMIAGTLVLCIFAILAFSIDAFWQMTLDDAVRNAARKVQDKTIQSGPAFVNAVCGEFGAVAPDCANRLQYSVQSNSSFGSMTPAILSSTGRLAPSAYFSVDLAGSTQFQYQTGSGGTGETLAQPQFLLVQVAYLVPFDVLILPAGVATENGTPALLSAVAAVMQ